MPVEKHWQKFKAPEQGNPKAEIQEKTGAVLREGAAEKTASLFSRKNLEFFRKMPDDAKEIANKLYEGVYKTPGVNRIVGKMEIAYNQFWLDRHEGKAAKLKGEMQGIDLQTGALEQSKKEIYAVIENLRKQNVPGVEHLRLKLSDLDKQKTKIEAKKEKVQAKLEQRKAKMESYSKERDRVADKLIGRYEEKVKPLLKEWNNLSEQKDHLDLTAEVMGVKHKEQFAQLDDIEKRKLQIEDGLKRAGMSEKAVRKFAAVKALDETLKMCRERIEREKEIFAAEQTRINEKIAENNKKTKDYWIKRSEFVDVKERKPLKMEAQEKDKKESAPAESKMPVTVEIQSKEKKERHKTSSFLIAWNTRLEYLQKKSRENTAYGIVNPKEFLRITGLWANFYLDAADFKNILRKYYKLRKIPTDKLDKHLDEIFPQTIGKTE